MISSQFYDSYVILNGFSEILVLQKDNIIHNFQNFLYLHKDKRLI